MKLRPYKKHFDYSYTFGAFATFELLLSRRADPRTVVYIHSSYKDAGKLAALCAEKNVRAVFDDRIFGKIVPKENTLVFAVFLKYTCTISGENPHICLVNPGDTGNLGSIFRTALAFGVKDIAIITPAADVFDPKCVRASMGAVFRADFRMYGSFDCYRKEFPGHSLFPFMTDGASPLRDAARENSREKYTLIFGGEAAGLPDCFKSVGKAVRIPQNSAVDSHNLSVAVGIGLYEFAGRMK